MSKDRWPFWRWNVPPAMALFLVVVQSLLVALVLMVVAQLVLGERIYW